MEMYSLGNGPRNRMNLARMLLRYGGRDNRTMARAAGCILAYAWGLSLVAFQPPERRVMMRTVSVPGWLYVRFREMLDRRIMVLVPGYRE